MKKTTKSVLLTGLMGALIAGCATEGGPQKTSQAPAQKQAQQGTQTKQSTQQAKAEAPIHFSYPLNIHQEPANHHVIGILIPHIQSTDNLKSHIQDFQTALVGQIKEIFQKRGYEVELLDTRDQLTDEEKHKIWAVLDLTGWMGVLEDVRIDLDDPESDNNDKLVDESAGALFFKFFEPESGRIIHNFGVNVGTYQAFNHTYTYRSTNSGGFSGSRIETTEEHEVNTDKAIHKILTQMYAGVMQKLVEELTDSHINRYRKAIEQTKNSKK
ncbi:putative paralog of HpaA [Helicobacter bizzozeronii CCUG 35545]|nr:putative paralog of HpaA [Helicobacter bizzozeronii CCUG 35545]